MKYTFIAIIMLLCISSSFARKGLKKAQKSFTNCYTGQKTNIRSLLNIDGYFKMTGIGHFEFGSGKTKTLTDSISYYFVLYDDGTFIDNITDGSKGFRNYFQQLSENNEQLDYIGDWGIYKIEGDSIIVAQCIDNRKSKWRMWELRFRIVNRNRLIYRQRSDLLNHSKQDVINLKKGEQARKILPVEFIPCDIMIPPKSWLKKEDWSRYR